MDIGFIAAESVQNTLNYLIPGKEDLILQEIRSSSRSTNVGSQACDYALGVC